jgi:hypothetical protein
MEIWYSLLSFGIFPPVLVYCTTKNLATLLQAAGRKKRRKRELEFGQLGSGDFGIGKFGSGDFGVGETDSEWLPTSNATRSLFVVQVCTIMYLRINVSVLLHLYVPR